MGKKVICTCPMCVVKRVVVHGGEIPGDRISQQLRRVHELAATANASPEYKKTRKSKAHPIGVEEFSDEENKPALSEQTV